MLLSKRVLTWSCIYDENVTKRASNNHVLRLYLYNIDPLPDNDVDLITYMNKMFINENLSFHDNHVLRVYLYLKMWVNKRVQINGNEIDVITYIRKM